MDRLLPGLESNYIIDPYEAILRSPISKDGPLGKRFTTTPSFSHRMRGHWTVWDRAFYYPGRFVTLYPVKPKASMVSSNVYSDRAYWLWPRLFSHDLLYKEARLLLST